MQKIKNINKEINLEKLNMHREKSQKSDLYTKIEIEKKKQPIVY